MSNSEFLRAKENLANILAQYDDTVRVEEVLDDNLYAPFESNTLLLQILLELACKNIEPNPQMRQILFLRMWSKLTDAKLINEVLPHADVLYSVRNKGASDFEKEIKKEQLKIAPSPSQDPLIPSQFELSTEPTLRLNDSHRFGIESSICPEKYRQEFLELNRIGRGGFGTVWKAKHKIDDVTYAIKKIIFKYNQDSDYLKVIREVKSFATLNHLNIVGYNQAWLEYVHYLMPNNSESDSLSSSSKENSDSDESVHSENCSTSFENSTLSYKSNKSSLTNRIRILSEENSDDAFITFREDSKTCLQHTKSSQSNFCYSNSSDKSKFFSPQKIPVLNIMLYIQMEYCDCDLRCWLDERAKGNPLPFHLSILEIFKDILNGVAHIHSKNIIHRDLKPQNIFYSAKNKCMKIGDFGLSALDGEEGEQLSQRSNCGTLPYAAPEQRSHHNYDCKVDMYSLGVILTELLIDAKTVMELDAALRSLLAGVVPEKLTKDSPDYVALVKSLVSKDPDLRPYAQNVLSNFPVPLTHQLDQVNLLKIEKLQKTLAEKDEQLKEKDKRIKELEAMLAITNL